jgi:hypothetical protein
MRTLFKTCAIAALAVVTVSMLTGCASMRVLTSTPPVKAFVLEKPAEFTFGLGTKLTLPAGEYKPVMEDNNGYYYQAPTKIVARDIFSYVADGGVYLRRDESTPSHWYAIDQQNYTKMGKLPKDFQIKTE